MSRLTPLDRCRRHHHDGTALPARPSAAAQIQVDGAFSSDDMTDEEACAGSLFAEGAVRPAARLHARLRPPGHDRPGATFDHLRLFPDPDILESFVRASPRQVRDEYVAGQCPPPTRRSREGDNNRTLPTQGAAGPRSSAASCRACWAGPPPWVWRGWPTTRLSDTDGPDGTDVAAPHGLPSTGAAGHGVAGRRADGGRRRALRRHSTTPGKVRPCRAPKPGSRRWSGSNCAIRWPASPRRRQPICWSRWCNWPGPTSRAARCRSRTAASSSSTRPTLLSLDRFPGQDQRETGCAPASAWPIPRTDPLGLVRWAWPRAVVLTPEEDQDQFHSTARASTARQSDYPAGHPFFHLGRPLAGSSTARCSTAALPSPSNELALSWVGDGHGVPAPPSPGWPPTPRSSAISTWPNGPSEADYEIDDGWVASADWRYDFVEDAPTRAGLAIGLPPTNASTWSFRGLAPLYHIHYPFDPSTEFGLTVSPQRVRRPAVGAEPHPQLPSLGQAVHNKGTRTVRTSTRADRTTDAMSDRLTPRPGSSAPAPPRPLGRAPGRCRRGGCRGGRSRNAVYRPPRGVNDQRP